MKIVYNWLKEFVDATAPATELRSRLSLAGMAVDSLEESADGPVLDIEVTANRPDCLGHYGVAREVAAIYRLPVKPLAPKLKESAQKAADAVRVEIESPELCGRYTGRVLRGVKVQPSPDWLRRRPCRSLQPASAKQAAADFAPAPPLPAPRRNAPGNPGD